MESPELLPGPRAIPPKPATLETRQHPAHRCPACNKAFVSAAALRDHSCLAGGKSANSCPVCGKEFKFPYYLARHRLTHGRQKPFRCKLCHKTFSRSAHLARHKCPQAAKHSPGGPGGSRPLQEPGKFLPPEDPREKKVVAPQVGMNNGVTSVSAAPNQKRVLLQEDWTLLCLSCNEAFETKGELKAHTCFKEAASHDDTEEQEEAKLHQCGVCHKNFARPWSLARHYVVHTGEKPFSCPECGMAFRLASYLRQHSRMHAANRDCPLLGRSDAQEEEAASPTFASSPTGPSPKKAYGCSVCGKPFKSKYDLATHFLIHTGALPFQCSRCGKRFRRLSHLKQHHVTHTAARPFQCVMCQKEFKRLADLARHRQVHEGDKPHQCGVCHKFFSRSYSLLRHQRSHLPAMAAVARPDNYLSNSCFDSQDHSAFLGHEEGEEEEEGEEGVGNPTEASCSS
ncbi:zinc finger protein 579 [Sphaerodactylus townsendi]|uniref:zinc finger protein 579 n=1 Tax=Sphaerodactylus townsendi TaxID=933632 RepID=UPI002026922A|nr:zinc finger protein 579 [Sphaerodactylus townsendi]XP_048373056.1 zinc finger protein 579 [Sphaerodactylus townsendi]